MNTEGRIKKLRQRFIDATEEFLIEQDKLEGIQLKPDIEQIVMLLGTAMKKDDLFQHMCKLGIAGAEVRGVSSEDIECAMRDFVDASKELRDNLAQKKLDKALFFLTQFQLLQRKVLREVANILAPEPLYELSKLEGASLMSKNFFIVHGRADKPKLELARLIAKLGFNPIILSEQPDKGRTIIEKPEQETLDVGYAFVILTPDDVGIDVDSYEEMKKEENQKLGLRYRARQNVIWELGYFVGKIGRERVCCLYTGDIELPSDILGVVYKKFNANIGECYEGIVKELKSLGYNVNA